MIGVKFMYIIIVGCSMLGGLLATDLSNAGHDVSVVDMDQNNLGSLGSGFNGLVIRGVEYDNEVLKEAGIEQADYLIAASESDSINITVSLIAKKIYKVPNIVAKINKPNKKEAYTGLKIETISPTEISAQILENIIEGVPNEIDNYWRR
jgi:trk system potassium uptake protein TrkA